MRLFAGVIAGILVVVAVSALKPPAGDDFDDFNHPFFTSDNQGDEEDFPSRSGELHEKIASLKRQLHRERQTVKKLRARPCVERHDPIRAHDQALGKGKGKLRSAKTASEDDGSRFAWKWKRRVDHPNKACNAAQAETPPDLTESEYDAILHETVKSVPGRHRGVREEWSAREGWGRREKVGPQETPKESHRLPWRVEGYHPAVLSRTCEHKTAVDASIGDSNFQVKDCARECDMDSSCRGFSFYLKEGRDRHCWLCSSASTRESKLGDQTAVYLKKNYTDTSITERLAAKLEVGYHPAVLSRTCEHKTAVDASIGDSNFQVKDCARECDMDSSCRGFSFYL